MSLFNKCLREVLNEFFPNHQVGQFDDVGSFNTTIRGDGKQSYAMDADSTVDQSVAAGKDYNLSFHEGVWHIPCTSGQLGCVCNKFGCWRAIPDWGGDSEGPDYDGDGNPG